MTNVHRSALLNVRINVLGKNGHIGRRFLNKSDNTAYAIAGDVLESRKLDLNEKEKCLRHRTSNSVILNSESRRVSMPKNIEMNSREIN